MCPNLLLNVIDSNGKWYQKTCCTIYHWSCDWLIAELEHSKKIKTWRLSHLKWRQSDVDENVGPLSFVKEKLTVVTEVTCYWQKKSWIMNLVWGACLGHYPVGGPMTCNWNQVSDTVDCESNLAPLVISANGSKVIQSVEQTNGTDNFESRGFIFWEPLIF